MSIVLDEIRELSVAERMKLLDEIWESLLDEPELPSLSPAQMEAIDRRLEAYRQHGGRGISWEELELRLDTA